MPPPPSLDHAAAILLGSRHHLLPQGRRASFTTVGMPLPQRPAFLLPNCHRPPPQQPPRHQVRLLPGSHVSDARGQCPVATMRCRDHIPPRLPALPLAPRVQWPLLGVAPFCSAHERFSKSALESWRALLPPLGRPVTPPLPSAEATVSISSAKHLSRAALLCSNRWLLPSLG